MFHAPQLHVAHSRTGETGLHPEKKGTSAVLRHRLLRPCTKTHHFNTVASLKLLLMSAALINRSLTTIRTELEFLHDSEVIDKALFEKLVASIPQKYAKDMQPWGVDKLAGETSTPKISVEEVSQSMASVTVQDTIAAPLAPPVPSPPKPQEGAIGYCKAVYNYDAQELGDLGLVKDDRIAVLEHLSPDWWKGYKQLEPGVIGIFPANYVSVISDSEFGAYARTAAPEKNEKSSYDPEKTGSSDLQGPPAYQAPPGSYGGYQVQLPMQQMQPMQQQMQPMQLQPLYGGYSQFPPPSTNYYAPQQQPQQQQQLAPPQEVQQQHTGGSSHPHLKKFGSKLGNAAIFGAGATIGSDIVNLIF